MRFVTCLTEQHDGRLVALALLICALGAKITMRLYRRMLDQERRARIAWLFLAAVAGVAFLVLGSGFASHVLDRLTRDEAQARLRHMVESSVDGMVVERGGLIVELNAAAAMLLDRPREQLLGTAFAEHLDASSPICEGTLDPTRLHRGGDVDVPVELSLRAVSDGEAGDLVVHAVRDLRPWLEPERRLHELGHCDSLTGLANRTSFLAELDTALARALPGHGLALLLIDLNDFELVNDRHGHAAGDAVLRIVADRLVAPLGSGEIAARLGGDAFAVLALRADRAAALELAERLRRALGEEVVLDAQAVRVSASIGIAMAPADGTAAAVLLANAELAMARPAASPGHAARLDDARIDDQLRERRRLTDERREALALGPFERRYQVQVRVADGAVTGYEALWRWRHPERGGSGPDQSIPLAEETGLILPIGAWMLRTACAEAASWPQPHKVALNLAAVQLGDPALPGLVAEALASSGLAPARLELEITETTKIADRARATAILERIKAQGVAIAMDDFGTGYSSLATLRAFAFDKIKLDRSFMAELDRGPQAAAVVRAVLALGSSLRIPVLAAGVKTTAQLAFLREQGCDEAQGYLLGRPAPAAEVGRLPRAAVAARAGQAHALAG